MSVRIELAQALAELADGEDAVTLQADTVRHALRDLGTRYPRLGELLWRGEALNGQLVAFLNRDDIRRLQGLDTPLAPGDKLVLITAVEGG
jgi:molybdopterin converting factor small subunit